MLAILAQLKRSKDVTGKKLIKSEADSEYEELPDADDEETP